MLKGRSGRPIGLVVPDLSDYFASCFHAIQKVAIQHNYQTLVVATEESRQWKIVSLNLSGIIASRIADRSSGVTEDIEDAAGLRHSDCRP